MLDELADLGVEVREGLEVGCVCVCVGRWSGGLRSTGYVGRKGLLSASWTS